MSVAILRRTARAVAFAVAVVVALVGALSVLGLLDRVSWVFLLAGVFRLQYIAVLGAAAVVALALRRVQLAAVAAALVALNMAAIGVPLTAPATAADGPTTGSLRLLIANVEVGNDRTGAVERLVRRVQPDVVGIVELTPSLASRLEERFLSWDDHAVWDESRWICEWIIQPHSLRDAVRCTGRCEFVELDADRTRFQVRGELAIGFDRVRGVPSFLAGSLGHTVESFLVRQITANLSAVSDALTAYLREETVA